MLGDRFVLQETGDYPCYVGPYEHMHSDLVVGLDTRLVSVTCICAVRYLEGIFEHAYICAFDSCSGF